MNIPVQDLRGAVFYGWLWKRGHTFKTWKKRFFLLNGAALTYYTQCCVITWDTTNNSNNSNNTNNHNNHKNNNIQCLDLPVRGGLRVAAVDASDLTSFGLKVTSSSGRVLYVQAGDQDARSQWLKVLSHAPQRRAAHLGQEPLRQTMASDLSSRRSFQLGLDDQSPSMDTVLSGASSDDDTTSGGADAGEMQGYLTVRGGLLSGWKKRYVVLQNGHLGLRRRRVGGPEPVTKQLEVLSAAAWPGHAHGLRIRLAHHKELFVFAAHDADAALWLAALKSC
ncbi:unnamed protein product [Hyaloperonospora brassicae]|uniref:PH domain-containing protein n=1 Tax=Hyaloperonospora brassicae TaxID=162125 RepID=A0AAV0TBN2_HYABA|nr:unnamed protein product [Hyaloperonospora brassicae]